MSTTTAKSTVTAKLEKREGCIQAALNILGDKWSPLLLGQLIASPKTFCELETALGGISPRTLSARLEKMADHDIIAKQLYCKHPPRYRYELTNKGRELQSILKAMGDWGDKYHNA
ncbi:transcriptional regulator [bacterium]|nr:transcriptional regulator [bacterium]NBX98279.1 transcriptional regulator [bacterium]NDC95203.1 transcriptional regulator [bacterium]NDD84360.1 transcriptional regulator [bacterium]NDG31733.1 transcriptional regulator [bacterium]